MTNRPNAVQRVRYLAGRPLPDSMRVWVRGDVLGPGARRRYFLRGLSLMLPLVVICLFIPGSLWLRLGMVLLVLIPVIYFEFALYEVYRRHLLASNGLDPDLVKAAQREREERLRRDYERRRGL